MKIEQTTVTGTKTSVVSMVKTRKPLKKVLRHWQLYLVISLPTAFLVVFNYIPMLGAQIAFKNYSAVKGIWHSPWIGFKEFSFFLTSPFFWPVFRNTLVLSIYSLVVGTLAAIILALALNEVRNQRFKRVVQMVTYAPYFISTVVLIGIMQIILSPSTGIYGSLASLFGIQNPPDVLSNPGAFPSLYVWSGVWQEAGYGAVIYLASLSSVNPELYEAAKIDGASRLQKIFHIDFPTIRPTIIVLVILSIGTLLGIGFEKVYLLQNPLNLSTSEIIATYVFKLGLVNANYSFATAVGLFNAAIGFVLILLANFLARRFTESSLF